ncbi:hypothetical protein B484DRAFT_352354 [Ochromonadaceae sp. CCMP2298]|nr:hypothetical protein B484DRAFT_352354 [Ochromonadaceae sp. CCMP2298]
MSLFSRMTANAQMQAKSAQQRVGGGSDRNTSLIKLYVKNLSRTVTAEHLREIFGSYGDVKGADVNIDMRNGFSKGSAQVSFASAKDAEHAMIYLDGGQIDHSVISVSDDPHRDERKSNHDVIVANQVRSAAKVDRRVVAAATAPASSAEEPARRGDVDSRRSSPAGRRVEADKRRGDVDSRRSSPARPRGNREIEVARSERPGRPLAGGNMYGPTSGAARGERGRDSQIGESARDGRTAVQDGQRVQSDRASRDRNTDRNTDRDRDRDKPTQARSDSRNRGRSGGRGRSRSPPPAARDGFRDRNRFGDGFRGRDTSDRFGGKYGPGGPRDNGRPTLPPRRGRSPIRDRARVPSRSRSRTRTRRSVSAPRRSRSRDRTRARGNDRARSRSRSASRSRSRDGSRRSSSRSRSRSRSSKSSARVKRRCASRSGSRSRSRGRSSSRSRSRSSRSDSRSKSRSASKSRSMSASRSKSPTRKSG